jgi:hypothetical protein
VAALTAATAEVALPVLSTEASSGRPAWCSSRSTQAVPARPSRVSAHSAHPSPAGHRVPVPARSGIATVPLLSIGASVPRLRPGNVTAGRYPNDRATGAKRGRPPPRSSR